MTQIATPTAPSDASITRAAIPAVTAAAGRRRGALRRWSVAELLARAVVRPPAVRSQ